MALLIKSKRFPVAVATVILLSFAVAQSQIKAALTGEAKKTRIEKWREDLRCLAEQLPVRHANFHEKLSRDKFIKMISRLEAALAKLTDRQMMIEIARLLALVGDGHTGVFLPWDRQNGFRKYPIEVWMAGDGLLVLAASSDLGDIIGAKITRIGRRRVEEVIEAIRPLLPLDNEFAIRSLIPHYIVLPELLHSLGLIQDMEHLELTVDDAQGRTRTVYLNPVARDAKTELRMIASSDSLPLWLRRREEKYWFEYLKDHRAVYLQFNSADVSVGDAEKAFVEFCERVVEFVNGNEVEKFIVDLRWNSGGNAWRTRHLLHALIRCDKINRPGKLFTIISHNTYSAAVLQAIAIEQRTHSLFVGEPTGGRPGQTGELRRFRLPNSNTEIRYSAVYHNPSDPMDHRPAIFPDLKAGLSLIDYRNGVDSALEAILNYKPKRPIGDAIRASINNQGIQAVIRQYEQLKREHYNEYDFSETELNALASDLINSNHLDAAIALLRLNAESYPYSPNVYFNLAEALKRAGRKNEAIENYGRAFKLDKRFSRALENIQRLRDMSP